jgi:hypothetical protein
MGKQPNLKSEISAILDEILAINQDIILLNDQGLTIETIEGLRLYKNDLDLYLTRIKKSVGDVMY